MNTYEVPKQENNVWNVEHRILISSNWFFLRRSLKKHLFPQIHTFSFANIASSFCLPLLSFFSLFFVLSYLFSKLLILQSMSSDHGKIPQKGLTRVSFYFSLTPFPCLCCILWQFSGMLLSITQFQKQTQGSGSKLFQKWC